MSASKPLILCTGGAGFIGGHTAIQLANTGRYRVLIADNLSNATKKAVQTICSLCPENTVQFIEIDLAKEPEKLKDYTYDAVIHFAALKSVSESVAMPLEYYRNNLNAMINVIQDAQEKNAKLFLFSSSATVYQPSEELLTEEHPLGPCNPYGQTKIMGEQILKDVFVSDNTWKIINLRYFNPIGAHPSGMFGEDCSKASNIMPAIIRSLNNEGILKITGIDWNTPDGTGIRDYVHVMDIADGHVAALDALFKYDKGQLDNYNLGTGTGASVLELVHAFEKASGKTIARENAPRRPGDLAKVIADPSKALKDLKFKPVRSIDEACVDAWRWVSTHPRGFNA